MPSRANENRFHRSGGGKKFFIIFPLSKKLTKGKDGATAVGPLAPQTVAVVTCIYSSAAAALFFWYPAIRRHQIHHPPTPFPIEQCTVLTTQKEEEGRERRKTALLSLLGCVRILLYCTLQQYDGGARDGGGGGRRKGAGGGREGGYSQGSTVTIPHYSDCVFVQESHSG